MLVLKIDRTDKSHVRPVLMSIRFCYLMALVVANVFIKLRRVAQMERELFPRAGVGGRGGICFGISQLPMMRWMAESLSACFSFITFPSAFQRILLSSPIQIELNLITFVIGCIFGWNRIIYVRHELSMSWKGQDCSRLTDVFWFFVTFLIYHLLLKSK